MSHKVDSAMATWEKNGSASLGKKTAANLEIMRNNIQDKLSDINETWQTMVTAIRPQEAYYREQLGA